jgi:hypothetical protein
MMTKLICSIAILFTLCVAFWLGHRLATIRAQVAITQGPWSDDVLPALHSVSSAKVKIHRGDTNILSELDQTEHHLERMSEWMQKWSQNSQQPTKRDK